MSWLLSPATSGCTRSARRTKHLVTAVDLSFGEFQALVTKALKGAGYPWGLADDGAAAARQLAKWGVSPVGSIVDLLESCDAESVVRATDPAEWAQASTPLCPLSVGATLNDDRRAVGSDLPAVASVLLLAPFVHRHVSPTQAMRLTWSSGSLTVMVDGIAIDGEPPSAATLHIDEPPPEPPVPHASRVTIAASDLARLEHFAHRTYAPATEESRRRGAG